MSEQRHENRFPTTHWSIIARLKSPNRAEAASAVETICAAYRFPLYGYLRTTGLSHPDAEDVLHGFFEKLLRHDSLGQADQQRGKLRTFLLVSLSRFLANWQRSERRRHRRVQAESDLWDQDEARYRQDQAVTDSPDRYFDRRWAVELISHVRLRLGRHYEERGKTQLHDALAPFLVKDGSADSTLAAACAALDLTENAARVALHRLRKEFRELLLEEVRRTLDEGEDPRAEIQHLMSLFE